MNILRIWCIIEHGDNPPTMKKYCFLLKILKLQRFFFPPPHKSASCATGCKSVQKCMQKLAESLLPLSLNSFPFPRTFL